MRDNIELSERGKAASSSDDEVPVTAGMAAARTRHLQLACGTTVLVGAVIVGVTLGVMLSRQEGAAPGVPVKTSVVGDQVPLVLYQRWSGPGCAGAEGLQHQAAFAPGDCLSLLDNGFGGPENRRFMYECSSAGEIMYKEWRASRLCAGVPDKTENRTHLQNCFQDEKTKGWEKLSCGMQLDSIPGQAVTRHGCGQGGGVGGGGGQGQSAGASRGRTIPLGFCIVWGGESAKWSCLDKESTGQLHSGELTLVYQPFSGPGCSQKASAGVTRDDSMPPQSHAPFLHIF